MVADKCDRRLPFFLGFISTISKSAQFLFGCYLLVCSEKSLQPLKWFPFLAFFPNESHILNLPALLCSESNCIWMQLKISVFDESTKRSSWTSRGMIFCFFVPDSKVCLGSPETEWSSWPWCWAATSFRPAFQVGLGILVWPQKARAEWLCQEWLRLSHILGTWVMTKTCKAVSLPWGFLETRIEAE